MSPWASDFAAVAALALALRRDEEATGADAVARRRVVGQWSPLCRPGENAATLATSFADGDVGVRPPVATPDSICGLDACPSRAVSRSLLRRSVSGLFARVGRSPALSSSEHEVENQQWEENGGSRHKDDEQQLGEAQPGRHANQFHGAKTSPDQDTWCRVVRLAGWERS